ncbi:hypothetical protein B566_EDAN009551 [Ephemera danica]|nr:hypothetical protein B566_EDAN009551 [Ephemera danica]
MLAARCDDEARTLLQAWEAFQSASSLEEPKRTLSAETRFFQQRAQLLERVLLTLGSEVLARGQLAAAGEREPVQCRRAGPAERAARAGRQPRAG